MPPDPLLSPAPAPAPTPVSVSSPAPGAAASAARGAAMSGIAVPAPRIAAPASGIAVPAPSRPTTPSILLLGGPQDARRASETAKPHIQTPNGAATPVGKHPGTPTAAGKPALAGADGELRSSWEARTRKRSNARPASTRSIAFHPALDGAAPAPSPKPPRGAGAALAHHARALMRRVLAFSVFAWVPARLNRNDLKTAFRVGLSMWLGYLLLLIHPAGMELGPAAFLVLIVSCMIPPTPAIVQYIETIFNLLMYMSLSWCWVCIGTVIAQATREPTDPAKIAAAKARWAHEAPAKLADRLVYEGTYLQARPAVICSIWLSVGTGALLWWKLRTQPSAATFPIVLSCILIDISLTLTPLYPTANYLLPWMVFKPVVIQAAISLVCSIFVFPQSASHRFRTRFAGVIDPIHQALRQLEELFSEGSQMATFGIDDDSSHRHVEFNAHDPEIDRSKLQEWGDRSASIRATLLGSLAGMPALRGLESYLAVDISYGRLGGQDLTELFHYLSQLQLRASGMSFFFNAIVNNARQSHMDSAAFTAKGAILSRTASRVPSRSQSRQGSRPPSRSGSRPASVRESFRDSPRDSSDAHDGADTPPHGHHSEDEHYEGHDDHTFAHRLQKRLRQHSGNQSRSSSPNRFGHKGSHHSLHSHKGSHLSLLEHLRKAQQPVGVYESQRYMDIERASEKNLDILIDQLELLAKGARPLAKSLCSSLSLASAWCHGSDRRRRAQEPALRQAYDDLGLAVVQYKDNRHEVLQPYRHLFDPSHPPPQEDLNKLQHRGLFYCFSAQYHLIEVGEALHTFLRKVLEFDAARPKRRLWLPKPWSLIRQYGIDGQRRGEAGEDYEREEHPEPEERTSAEFGRGAELGEARRRNPDYEPFDTPLMNLISMVSKVPDLLLGRSAMYALKAGLLGCLTTLPAFLSSTASFYYYNRGIWCTIMAQMTLAAFSGDTFSSWLSRIQATFWGIVMGLAVWYIGSGSGKGNPYGMGVVSAITFFLIMFYRTCGPGSVLTQVVFTTSVSLVVGYSWLNGNLFQMSSATWGWNVAWLRFVCVVIGITAAWFWSMVPPSYSAKVSLRHSYSHSISRAGRILCDVLAQANDPHKHVSEERNARIRSDIHTARAKLTKLGMRHGFANRELSIRGRWPKERYLGLLTTLQEIMSLFALLNHVIHQMDLPWRRALLLRTRLSDPLFLGDVFAVITMSHSALFAGAPLPQITPGPLVAKYHMGKSKGLSIPHDPMEHQDDLPNHVTPEVLESEEYMRYALAVSCSYALMARLDALVVVVKTLVGETYGVQNYHLEHLGYNGQA